MAYFAKSAYSTEPLDNDESTDIESRSLQDWSVELAPGGCAFNTATSLISCAFNYAPVTASITFATEALTDLLSIDGAIGAAVATDDGNGGVQVEIPMLDLPLALSAGKTTDDPDSFGFMISAVMSSGAFTVIDQDFQVIATVDANNGGAGVSFTVDSGNAEANTVDENNFTNDIDPRLSACQADSVFDCYDPGTALAIAQGSFLYLKITTDEPLVMIESIPALSFQLFLGGSETASITQPIITDVQTFTNGLTTVTGEQSKEVLITTILPATFYIIAAEEAESATIGAFGTVNFAPSDTRKLLRDSSSSNNAVALSDAGIKVSASIGNGIDKPRKLQQDQGGFAIEGISLASTGTSGALHSIVSNPAVLATGAVMAAGVVGDFW